MIQTIGKKNIAQLSFSLDVPCPKCGEDVDLTQGDDFGTVTKALFNNRWNDLTGHEFTCDCGCEFTLDGVEY